MTNTPGVADHANPEQASFFAQSKKAFTAGTLGLVSGAGGAFTTAFADGSISQGDIWTIVSFAVGGFVAAFAATYAATNAPATKPTPTDSDL